MLQESDEHVVDEHAVLDNMSAFSSGERVMCLHSLDNALTALSQFRNDTEESATIETNSSAKVAFDTGKFYLNSNIYFN